MAKFILTNSAVQDLSDIWDYTFDNWSESQADKYYNQIIEQCDYLSRHPAIGRNYSKLHKDLRGFNINKHIIFYRIIKPELIEIERVLHEQMDLKTKLLE